MTTRPAGTPTPRCLHCKVGLTEKQALTQEPYGRWVVFGCATATCPVCGGVCRHEERVFLPIHWQEGPPGQIFRI
ncbi:hypothetical protein [Kribbella soli]|uniref:Uncharacterized protein n=1 Tax=Kribbella soli TaxID=1124743 RepID=A0A4R0HKM5_9ACTN|nr:hypothetical protein [Kribbella soli]TCC10404.1 hypothetical protein E0H45_03500 [Kribbella soli]